MPTITPPSPLEVALRFVAYVMVGVIGVWALFQPAQDNGTAGMSGAIGQWLTYGWAAMIMTAFLAAGATVVGRFRVEYVTLPLFGSALILATLYVWLLIGDYPTAIGRAAISTVACLQLGIRYWTLHRLMRRGATSWTSDS